MGTDATEQEREDADRVDEAMTAMQEGRLGKAETLLSNVIANTPSPYEFSYERDGNLYIKFWDQEEFISYVMHLKETGKANQSIYWVRNAYGRAHFYYGFLAVKQKQYEKAVARLDAGLRLEPEQPYFRLEKAKALGMLEERKAALQEYEVILSRGDDVAPTPRAVALRGKGFQLIELDRLDEAEAAFHESLEYSPNNEIALNELAYIEYRRSGGRRQQIQVAETKRSIDATCSVCGRNFKKGSVQNTGVPFSFVCEDCEKKASKPWWKFW